MAGIAGQPIDISQSGAYVTSIQQPSSRLTQGGLLVSYKQPPSTSVEVSQAPVLVAHRSPPTRTVAVSQIPANILYSRGDNAVIRVSQSALLMAWKTGVAGQTRQRAWTFDFDGHTFYVLDLAQEGTWVYDFTTEQWSKFETPGYGVWNLLNGFAWESNRMVVGGDSIYPIVNVLDPTTHLDDGWRPVEYKVTAGLSARDRDGKSMDSVRLGVSAGYMADPMPTITMRFSDDNGATWSQDYPFQLVSGQYSQRVEWNSLGTFGIPGRVIEFSDQGGLVRIDGADAQIDGQE